MGALSGGATRTQLVQIRATYGVDRALAILETRAVEGRHPLAGIAISYRPKADNQGSRTSFQKRALWFISLICATSCATT